MSDAISKAISIIEDMQAFLLGRRVPEYDHLMIEESAEAINALQALQRSAEPVVFTCHGNNAPAYGCNKPGDMSGTYYKAPQPPTTKPIAAIKGWFHGECVVQAFDPAAVLPAGMALYAAPQSVVPDGDITPFAWMRPEDAARTMIAAEGERAEVAPDKEHGFSVPLYRCPQLADSIQGVVTGRDWRENTLGGGYSAQSGRNCNHATSRQGERRMNDAVVDQLVDNEIMPLVGRILRKKLMATFAEIESAVKSLPPAQDKASLMDFYAVETEDALLSVMAKHIEKLQKKRRRDESAVNFYRA